MSADESPSLDPKLPITQAIHTSKLDKKTQVMIAACEHFHGYLKDLLSFSPSPFSLY